MNANGNNRQTSSVALIRQLRRFSKDPGRAKRRAAERDFLEKYVFHELEELRPKFDVPCIKHFWNMDFRSVVERCTDLGVQVVGVEVFTPEGELLEVCITESESNAWCLDLLNRFRHLPKLSFSATYQMPGIRQDGRVGVNVGSRG